MLSGILPYTNITDKISKRLHITIYMNNIVQGYNYGLFLKNLHHTTAGYVCLERSTQDEHAHTPTKSEIIK